MPIFLWRIPEYKIKKPTSVTEFKNWLKSALGYEINDKYQFYFDTVVKKLKTDFEESEYWKNLLEKDLMKIH